MENDNRYNTHTMSRIIINNESRIPDTYAMILLKNIIVKNVADINNRTEPVIRFAIKDEGLSLRITRQKHSTSYTFKDFYDNEKH